MAKPLSSTKWMRVLAACAFLLFAVVIAACGDDETTTTSVQTTTVTTAESETAAEGTTTTPDGQVITSEDPSSDAATAIPDDQSEVEGAQPEVATSTGPTGGVNGVVGEDPNSGVATPTSTTTVDPVTGDAVTTTVDPTTGETVTTAASAQTVTTTDPETGEVVTTTAEAGETITTTDPETGEVVTTTATAPETTAVTPTTAATTPNVTTVGSGVSPELNVDPTLPGADNAILSRPFSADSPWNTTITGDRLDRRSERWMELAEIRVALAEEQGDIDIDGDEVASFDVQAQSNNLKNCTNATGGNGNRARTNVGGADLGCRRIKTGLTINTTRWTLPVYSNTQDGAVERIAICRQFDCGPDAVSSIVIPPDACPDPRYDGWMTVIDNTTNEALDFWRARCENDGSISYHYVKKWQLEGPGFQQPGGVSARGSGLPLFAGLITPEEIRDGRIDHALAISVPGAASRRYVQPASRTDGTGLATSLPEGARLRLRDGAVERLSKTFVRNKGQRRVARTIIDALEKYGAIVVDRSAAPTLYAQRNADWTNILPLNLLQDIGLRRFEVVQAGQTFFDPPRGNEAGGIDITGVGSPPVSSGAGTQSPVLDFGTDPGTETAP